MSFVPNLPEFNLLASMWNPGFVPAADPPNLTDLPVQKYIYSRLAHEAAALVPQHIQLRLPTGSIILSNVGQIFEVPQGDARYFKCFQIFMQHEGFPNEYIMLMCSPVTAAGFLFNGRTNP